TAAAEIERRLGRKLGPQDLWYEFGAGDVAEAELDALTRKRYPTAAALAAAIAVDPSRGAGHAMPAKRRGDQPHLRTRVEAGGMDYKGYNIAIHELGHNVE